MDARSAPTFGPDRVPRSVWDVFLVLASLGAAFAPYRDPAAGPQSSILFDADGAAFVAAISVVGIQAGALLARRRAPLAVFIIEAALLIAGAFLADGAMPFIAPVAFAAYGLSKRRSRRTTVLALIMAIAVFVTVAIVVLTESRFGHTIGVDPRLFPAPAMLAFAAAAGDATKSRRAVVTALAERAERAEATRESEARRRVAEERLRIARDLHDAVAHEVAVVNLQSGVAARAIAPGREPDLPLARDSVDTVGRAARGILDQIGSLLSMLRADSAGDDSPASPQGLGSLDGLIAGFADAGLEITVRRDGATAQLPADVDRVAYLVLREALTNAHKHGSEHRAHVLIEQDLRALTVTVTNPVATGSGGQGLSGYGLLGLRERVAAVRGVLDAGRTGGAFRLRARIPLERATQHDLMELDR